MSLLSSVIIFLLAVVIAVPIFTRIKLGAILGYLCAGVIIGPSVLGLIDDPDQILHFAELGVVFLLFIIGLELAPQKLFAMRSLILLIGGGQLLLSIAAITAILMLVGLSFNISLVFGMALALSSTAFAIGLLKERGILNHWNGQKGFATLLMQDLAVIPILLIVTALAGVSNPDAPQWWISLSAVLLVLFAGKYLINPLLGILSRYGGSEVMTAAALLIVIATAELMYLAGLSMGLGAFMAGLLLANSSFRHHLEVEIAPFKGLLLGLFFIAIGMNLDLALLWQKPGTIVLATVTLIAVKTLIIWLLYRFFHVKDEPHKTPPLIVALMLSQGGEFAFVIFNVAVGNGLLPIDLANTATLVVGLSMALTVPLVMFAEKRFNKDNKQDSDYDEHREVDEPHVVIAGFGRFGQITGRILAANHIPFTALDNNAEHIEFVKQFGNKIFFGDATNPKLLHAAGIEHAKVVFIAADSDKHGFDIAKAVQHEYPHVKIIARAKSRLSVLKYRDLGINTNVREMFDSSLTAAKLVLNEYGFDEAKAEHMINVFKKHDEELLEKSYEGNKYDLQNVIKISEQGRMELESLFKQDQDDA